MVSLEENKIFKQKLILVDIGILVLSILLIASFIATLISNMLLLKFYDTQCGCKVLTRKLSIQVFADSFISRWLFDVALFFRMKSLYGNINLFRSYVRNPIE